MQAHKETLTSVPEISLGTGAAMTKKKVLFASLETPLSFQAVMLC